jgi:pyridoxine 5-phosphate synthase
MRQKSMSLTSPSLRLGVNIDHVATVRNARGGALPDPVRAALLAQEAGADGITAHLREDRRHIRDTDMQRLKAQLHVPLNFEMAATPEMLAIALNIKPHACCLVPEKREERTTEGGLDIVRYQEILTPFIKTLTQAGIRVSLFIEPDPVSLDIALTLKAPIVELHTGTWCHHVSANGMESVSAQREYERLVLAAQRASTLGLEVHAGHGLDYHTAQKLAQIPEFLEFNIGHFLMGEAMFVGLDNAIHTLRTHMNQGRSSARPSL